MFREIHDLKKKSHYFWVPPRMYKKAVGGNSQVVVQFGTQVCRPRRNTLGGGEGGVARL